VRHGYMGRRTYFTPLLVPKPPYTRCYQCGVIMYAIDTTYVTAVLQEGGLLVRVTFM